MTKPNFSADSSSGGRGYGGSSKPAGVADSSGGSSSKKSSSKDSGSGSVYYKNCSEVRAAGKAPIRRDDPGYAKRLDRDGDGVGCE